ncbi:MAG: MDR family MFS transporter [Gammaproteobacteria bacterium]|nr:MDR family MFS transporter [Gammaproteobacteria bacterium]
MKATAPRGLGTGPDEGRTSHADRMTVYLAILLALLLGALDQTIVATALPRIVEDLAGVERYTWVTTMYLLASTSLALVYGKLADTYARKHVTLAAVGLFLGGSVACGLAGIAGPLPLLGDGMSQLVISRGVQGMGAGGIFAMTFIVIADLFTPAERGKYQGYVGAVFGVSSVMGPLLGGLLTDHAGSWMPGIAGWRWVFLVNMPIGGIALWHILRRMPLLEAAPGATRPDFAGAGLLVGGLVPLVVGLQIDKQASPWLPWLASAPMAAEGAVASGGWQLWATPGLLALSAILLVAFVRRSRAVEGPILEPRLFSEPVFRRATLATFFFGAAFISINIFVPLFLVSTRGVSATEAGLVLIPFSLGIVISATLAGQVASRIGYRRQIVAGTAVFFLGAVLLARMDPSTAYWQVYLCTILCGLGAGPGMPLFTLAIQNATDVRFVGQATSASQFFRQTGATMGAAAMGAVLTFTLAATFSTLDAELRDRTRGRVSAQAYVSRGGVGLPEAILAAFEERAGEADSPDGAVALRTEGRAVARESADRVRLAFTRASQRIYWLVAFLTLAAGVLAARIPEIPLRRTHDRAKMERTGKEAEA